MIITFKTPTGLTIGAELLILGDLVGFQQACIKTPFHRGYDGLTPINPTHNRDMDFIWQANTDWLDTGALNNNKSPHNRDIDCYEEYYKKAYPYPKQKNSVTITRPLYPVIALQGDLNMPTGYVGAKPDISYVNITLYFADRIECLGHNEKCRRKNMVDIDRHELIAIALGVHSPHLIPQLKDKYENLVLFEDKDTFSIRHEVKVFDNLFNNLFNDLGDMYVP